MSRLADNKDCGVVGKGDVEMIFETADSNDTGKYGRKVGSCCSVSEDGKCSDGYSVFIVSVLVGPTSGNLVVENGMTAEVLNISEGLEAK